MKRLFAIGTLCLAAALAVPAQAHGGGGGWRGGYAYGHAHGHHHHGGGRGWVAPVLGAAIIGSAIYAASTPSYATAPVIVAPPAPQRVAYYCTTWGQYYPAVQTCPTPWQIVPY